MKTPKDSHPRQSPEAAGGRETERFPRKRYDPPSGAELPQRQREGDPGAPSEQPSTHEEGKGTEREAEGTRRGDRFDPYIHKGGKSSQTAESALGWQSGPSRSQLEPFKIPGKGF